MKTQLSPRQIWERSISEEDVLGAIRNFLELHRARVSRIVERIPYGRRTSEPGIPDIYGYFHQTVDGIHVNEHFWIEVKRPGGKRRSAQEAWIRQAQEDGVIAFFAESVDDVIREFKSRGINL